MKELSKMELLQNNSINTPKIPAIVSILIHYKIERLSEKKWRYFWWSFALEHFVQRLF